MKDEFAHYKALKIAADIQRAREHPRTNAERIRNMSDEELAEFITGLNEHCLAGIGEVDCSSFCYCEDNCRRMIEKWLQTKVGS